MCDVLFPLEVSASLQIGSVCPTDLRTRHPAPTAPFDCEVVMSELSREGNSYERKVTFTVRNRIRQHLSVQEVIALKVDYRQLLKHVSGSRNGGLVDYGRIMGGTYWSE